MCITQVLSDFSEAVQGCKKADFSQRYLNGNKTNKGITYALNVTLHYYMYLCYIYANIYIHT